MFFFTFVLETINHIFINLNINRFNIGRTYRKITYRKEINLEKVFRRKEIKISEEYTPLDLGVHVLGINAAFCYTKVDIPWDRRDERNSRTNNKETNMCREGTTHLINIYRRTDDPLLVPNYIQFLYTLYVS